MSAWTGFGIAAGVLAALTVASVIVATILYWTARGIKALARAALTRAREAKKITSFQALHAAPEAEFFAAVDDWQRTTGILP